MTISSLTSRTRGRAGYVMLAPSVILLAVFVILPVGMLVTFAFTNRLYPGSTRLPMRFVGIDNFSYLAQDEDFLVALTHNVAFTAAIVPVQTALALALALLVNGAVPGRAFFRAAFFLPVAVPVAVSGMVWKLLLDDGAGQQGLVSTVIHTVTGGHVTPDWWGTAGWAQTAVVLVSLWSSTGFQMIILLAALQDVPQTLHEAAMLDGAGAWRRFLAVTLPAIRHPLYFVVSVTAILSFRLFDTVWVLPPGPGEPRGSTSTLMLYMVELAQRVPNAPIGRASAASLAFLVIVLAVTLVQRRFEPKDV